MSKVVLFDIETTNLSANYGYMLCAAWKVFGEKKVQHLAISDFPRFKKDPTNDRDLVKAFAAELSKADVIVGHYSLRFDFPYVQSRLLNHNLKPMPPIPHVDTWRIARYQMRLNSNRLQSIADFLGLEDKTKLSGPIWIKAMSGHKPSIKYVVDHCIQDVNVLEQVYAKIRPLCRTHPNVNLVTDQADSCPVCGTQGRLQKRGFTIARSRRRQRYQCMACGGWSHGKSIPVKNISIS